MIKLYDRRDEVGMITILSSVSPMVAIMLTLEIIKVNATIIEQAGTLAMILLPYVNKVSDYSFIPSDADHVMIECVTTLSNHIKDMSLNIESGFITLGLKYKPSSLQDIIPIGFNRAVLTDTLVRLGYRRDNAEIITGAPHKFLWPDLLSYFNHKTDQTVCDCLTILNKMEILNDPGSLMSKLVDCFLQRSLILKCLLSVDRIDINLSKLIMVL